MNLDNPLFQVKNQQHRQCSDFSIYPSRWVQHCFHWLFWCCSKKLDSNANMRDPAPFLLYTSVSRVKQLAGRRESAVSDFMGLIRWLSIALGFGVVFSNNHSNLCLLFWSVSRYDPKFHISCTACGICQCLMVFVENRSSDVCSSNVLLVIRVLRHWFCISLGLTFSSKLF